MTTNNNEKEKNKTNNQIKHIPKDAQVIMSILKEIGIKDYEPRVVNQLLEFTYRYVTCILDDAKTYANHAKKKMIDLDDVKLASEIVLDKSFTTPPPRHVLTKLAEARNSVPLPPIKPHCGLRLPPDRYCLTACNYKFRAASPPRKLIKSSLDTKATIKTQTKTQASTIISNGGVKRPAVAPPKTHIITIPKPIFKFTSTTKPVVSIKTEESKSLHSGDSDIQPDYQEDESKIGDAKRRKEDFEIIS